MAGRTFRGCFWAQRITNTAKCSNHVTRSFVYIHSAAFSILKNIVLLQKLYALYFRETIYFFRLIPVLLLIPYPIADEQ
jgi:hypothetical protein